MAQNEDRDARRDPYRDNDDVRQPLEGESRSGTTPDTKAEARGDARANVGNTSRGTDANATGAEGNDKQRGKPMPDSFDDDLARNRNAGTQDR